MSHSFVAGDDLVFQLESGFGLLRVLVVEEIDGRIVWHLMAYEDLFPDVESAEAALAGGKQLDVRAAHLAITDHALGKTPSARIGNRSVSEDELRAYREWQTRGGAVSDRSALLMLGLR